MKLHLPWHVSPVQTFFVVFMILLLVYLVGALMGLTVFDFENQIRQ